MRKEIEVRIEKAITEKVFPGCVAGVVRKSGERGIMPFGHFTYEQDSPEVREDTVYDMASVTKSIPVASLVLTFVAEGKLQLMDKVVKYLPELKNRRPFDISCGRAAAFNP
jgi:CubicO group peptidase (beta-lactamase class C family)